MTAVNSSTAAQTLFHPASGRGSADNGWLKVNHSFSFAGWYDPDKVHFGALRVLNDDQIDAQQGFGTHPHDNMEIITIPLTGALAHRDSMGNTSTINAGEIQVMSAGTGVQHSEFNPQTSAATQLFQIWIFPKQQNVQPRYDQFWMDGDKMKNRFAQLVSPDPADEGSWIHQDAWIKMAEIDAAITLDYTIGKPGNGVYFMLIEGRVRIEGQILEKRDALGVWNVDSTQVEALEASKILAIEVPMQF